MSEEKDVVILGEEDPAPLTRIAVRKVTDTQDHSFLKELEPYFELGDNEEDALIKWSRAGNGLALKKNGKFLVVCTDLFFADAILTRNGKMVCNGSKDECLEHWLVEVRKEAQVNFTASQIDAPLMQTINHKLYGSENIYQLITAWK